MSTPQSYIEKALKSMNLLTIEEFINETGFKIDKLYLDTFLKIIDNQSLDAKKAWIYLSDKMIDIIGFEGERFHKNNDCYRLLLKNFISNKDYKQITKKDPFFASLVGDAKNNSPHNKKFYVLTSPPERPEAFFITLLPENGM